MITSKATLTIGSLAFAVIFGGGVYLYMNLGGIVKQVAENVASDTLGVKVSIAAMEISLPERRVVVHGLSIGNPAGFKNVPAMRVREIEIALGSVSKELIVFQEISVSGTRVNLLVNQNGTNLSAIKKNAMKDKKKPPVTKGDKKPVKVIIHDLSLRNAELKPAMLLIGDSMNPVKIPDIRLRGIGQKQNGILVREAVAQVWGALSKDFNRVAASAGFLQGLSAEALRVTGVKALQTQVENIGGKAAKEISGALEKGLGSLFGN